MAKRNPTREEQEFNTGKYNEIMMSYVRNAVRVLVEDGILEDEQATAVRNEISYELDTKRAEEL